jgi:hypothetical protein
LGRISDFFKKVFAARTLPPGPPGEAILTPAPPPEKKIEKVVLFEEIQEILDTPLAPETTQYVEITVDPEPTAATISDAVLKVCLNSSVCSYKKDISIIFDTIEAKCKYIDYNLSSGTFHVLKSGEYNIFLWGTVLRKDSGPRISWQGCWALEADKILTKSKPQKCTGRKSMSGGIAAQLKLKEGDVLKFLFKTETPMHLEVMPKATGVILPTTR